MRVNDTVWFDPKDPKKPYGEQPPHYPIAGWIKRIDGGIALIGYMTAQREERELPAKLEELRPRAIKTAGGLGG